MDCLALVIIAVPDLEISGRFCIKRGAAGACSMYVGLSSTGLMTTGGWAVLLSVCYACQTSKRKYQ